ncbi:cell division protein ZapA [Evansella caseinilytica]|uniref:Cell division protein ZapA n=1 Tax=Evansella caseinilytica TaxID=1503961 RepID=A0A1H3TU27_9BACI|nr:cell division protein ZapA [Evansella caseinilytica]SDZ53740.1 cell division protein ZapA [Evansella caseinilytica]
MGEGHEKRRTSVTIYGQQYTIVGEHPPEHVKKVAALVDRKMKELKNNNPYLDSNKLAVLTAVNAVNDYLLLLEKLDKVQKDEDL